MRRLTKYLLGAVLFAGLFQSCEKPSPITSFTASQGNCIGAVRLAVEEVAIKENYSYERKIPKPTSGSKFTGDTKMFSMIPDLVYRTTNYYPDKNINTV